jgi:hypothetical protein
MTHAYLGLAAYDLMATAVGYALLFALGLARRPGSALRQLGLAFIAGWATVGAMIAIGVSLGVDPIARNVLLLAGGALVVCALASFVFPRVERAARPPNREPLLRLAAAIGAGLLAIGLVGSVLVASRAGADYYWDIWAFWIPKAKAIYYFHGLDTGLGGFLTYANPEYPPLVPASTAAVFHFMSGVHPALLPLQQSLLSVAFIASVLVLLAPRVPRWILFPTLAMLVLAPEFWGRMTSVVPDQETAYLLALAVLAGLLWLDDGRIAWLPLATIFLAAATLTKEEGFVLSVVLVVIVVAAGIAVHRWRAYPALLLALGPAAIKPWHNWLTAHGQRVAPPEYDWHDLEKPHFLSGRIGRFGFATHKMIDFIAGGGQWSLVLPLTVVVVVLAFVAHAGRIPAAGVTIWLVAGFFGLAAVYWIGAPEVHWYVDTSAQRVVDTIPLVAGTALPLLLALIVDRRSRRPELSPPAE